MTCSKQSQPCLHKAKNVSSLERRHKEMVYFIFRQAVHKHAKIATNKTCLHTANNLSTTDSTIPFFSAAVGKGYRGPGFQI